MARVIPVGYADVRVVLRAAGDPGPWNVTFGVDLDGVAGDYEAAGSAIADAYANAWLPNSSSQVTLESVDLIIGQDGPDHLIYSVPDGRSGAGSTGYLPQNCALLVQKRTNLGGRKHRGRMYLPNCLPDSQVDNIGVIVPSTVTAFQTTAADFLEDLNVGGDDGQPPVPMVILHSDLGGTPPAPTPVTSLNVSGTIATQRRRLR